MKAVKDATAGASFHAAYLQANDLPGHLAEVMADGDARCRLHCVMRPTCWAWPNSGAART